MASKRINRDDIDKLMDFGLYLPTRTLYIGSVIHSEEEGESGVDAQLTERVLKGLLILETVSKDPINIILNNPGGDVYQGMAIYDALKNCRSHITITVYGQAMSAASIVLQAADKRVLSANARVMIHYGEEGHSSNHPKITRAWSKQYERDEVVMRTMHLWHEMSGYEFVKDGTGGVQKIY
jgi:ATP-dependent protease ClpP protease subunit